MNIDNFVSYEFTAESTGLVGNKFGKTLFITVDDELGTANTSSVKTFPDFSSIEKYFSTTSEPYLAGKAYFNQSPHPQNLIVARWFNANVAGSLESGTVPELATLTAITAGSFTFKGTNSGSMDFSAQTTYAGIASVIQTALNTALTGATQVTITFNALRKTFIITNNTAGAAQTITYASAGQTDTDMSSTLKLTEATKAVLNLGANLETIQAFFTRVIAINSTWSFVTLESQFEDSATVTSVANWVEADGRRLFFSTSDDPNVLNTSENSTVYAQLFANQVLRTSADYSTEKYLALASAARLSSVDYDAINTYINPSFKQRIGFNAVSLTTAQETELQRKRMSSYYAIGGGLTSATVENIYFNGDMFKNGYKQNAVAAISWFFNAVQLAVFNLLIKFDNLAQTDPGNAQIANVIDDICKTAVGNRMISPNTVGAVMKQDIITVTGNKRFSGTLSTGYLVYFPPIADQSAEDRAADKSSPMYIWLKGSGSIDHVDLKIKYGA